MTHGMRAVPSALACVLAAVGVSACGGGTKLSEKTLKFTEKDTNDFGFVDNPPKTKPGKQGPEKVSNGDQLSFRASLLDSAKKTVGALDATCLITGAGGGRAVKASGTCQGTATVPGGSLFLGVGGKGVLGSSNTSGAVTGGSGKYAGATGSFTSVGGENSRDTYHIFLPKK
jgi:hypothetical protein